MPAVLARRQAMTPLAHAVRLMLLHADPTWIERSLAGFDEVEGGKYVTYRELAAQYGHQPK